MIIDTFRAPFGIETEICAGAEVFPVLHARCCHKLKGLHPHEGSAVFRSVEVFFHNDAMGEELQSFFQQVPKIDFVVDDGVAIYADAAIF